jgi:hypothetical protein
VKIYLELPDLLTFFAMVDASYGIYLYRWGDAPLLYLILAISATPEQIVRQPIWWKYVRGSEVVERQTSKIE